MEIDTEMKNRIQNNVKKLILDRNQSKRQVEKN